MDEFQILSLFNSGLISNGLYTAAAFFLLWVAFRGALIIYNEGAPLLNKILSTIFSLGIVYANLRNLALLDVNWESTAYSLSQLENLSEQGQRFVAFREQFGGVGIPEFSLIPNDPILLVWWIVVIIMLMASTWMKKA